MTIEQGVQYLNAVLFGTLMLVALRQWRRDSAAGIRPTSSRWFFATFVILAFVSFVGLVIPEAYSSAGMEMLVKAMLVALAIFPFCLYKFGTSFSPPTQLLNLIATTFTAVVAIWTLALPRLPQQGDDVSPIFIAWLAAFIAHWAVLSAIVTIRLWRAGVGQPGVVKSRMRLLAAGALALTVSLLVSVSAGENPPAWIEIVVSLLGPLAAAMFLLGFAPPAAVRLYWRRREQRALNDAAADLILSVSVADISQRVLPHAVRVIGGHGAVLIDEYGEVASRHNVSQEAALVIAQQLIAEQPEEQSGFLRNDLMFVRYQSGWLTTMVTPYTPYFGEEEIHLLRLVVNYMDTALDRIRLQESLGAAERRALKILGSTHEAFIELDAQGRIIDWNPAATATFGWSRIEAFGKKFKQLLIPQGKNGFPELWVPGAEISIGRVDETNMLHRDGHEFPVEFSITSLLVGVELFYHVFLRDITERHEADARERATIAEKIGLVKQLQNANRDLESTIDRFERTLDAIEVGVVLWGADGKIELRNRAARVLTGTEGVTDSRVDYALANERETGSRRVMLPRGHQGGSISVDLVVSQTRDGGIVQTFADTSSALSIDSARANFLITSARELRSPVEELSDFLPKALEVNGVLDLTTRSIARDRVLRSTERLHNVVDTLFESSLIASGSLEVELESVVVSEVIDEAWGRVKKTGATLEVRVPGSIAALADREALRRALSAVLDNALKYGSPPFRIDAMEGGDGVVRIEVLDHGTGIPVEERGSVFEPFHRVSANAQGGAIEGVGLGLYSARRLVEAMNGHVAIDSDPQGTIVVIEVPAAPDASLGERFDVPIHHSVR